MQASNGMYLWQAWFQYAELARATVENLEMATICHLLCGIKRENKMNRHLQDIINILS